MGHEDPQEAVGILGQIHRGVEGRDPGQQLFTSSGVWIGGPFNLCCVLQLPPSLSPRQGGGQNLRVSP